MHICDIITNFVQQECLKYVMMNPKNVAFTPLANLDNPKIAEKYAIENLVVTKNCVNTHTHTHTHTHSHRQYLAR